MYLVDQHQDEDLERRLGRAVERLRNFSMVGSPDITVEGGWNKGFAISKRPIGGIATGGPTGACCLGTECVVETQAQCAADGGIYLGNGSSCDPNPCSFTPPPTCCPHASLVCDQISASKSKCGFSEYGTPSSPPKYYLTKTNVYAVSHSDSVPKCPGGTAHSVGNVNTTDVRTFDANTCVMTCVASGTCQLDVTVSGDGAPPAGEVHCFGTRSVCGQLTAHTTSYNCLGVVVSDGNTTDFDVAVGAEYYPSNSCLNPSGSFSVSSTSTVYTITFSIGTMVATLSSEYTTAMLISNTIGALPAYDNDFNDTCQASRNLLSDESSYSISRFRYKFKWATPLAVACRICWLVRTSFTGGGTSNVQMCENVPAGATESTVHEALEPSSNGTVTVIYPVGVCCTTGACSVTDTATCSAGGGTYRGNSCADNPCSPNPC